MLLLLQIGSSSSMCFIYGCSLHLKSLIRFVTLAIAENDACSRTTKFEILEGSFSCSFLAQLLPEVITLGHACAVEATG